MRVRKRNAEAKRPAVPVGPLEMKSTDWLAQRPDLTDQIATVPYKLNRKG